MKMLFASLILGASVVVDRWSTPPKTQRIWGDGILDGGDWDAMSYSWDDVLLEELSLYSLALGRSAFEGDEPPVCQLLKRMVMARAWFTWRYALGAEEGGLKRLIRMLNARFPGISLEANDLYETGRDSALALYDDFEFHRVGASPDDEYERLLAIASLYRDARERSRTLGAALPEDRNDLSDALIASMQSDLNAAYVYREFEFAHELFLTGICLAQIARGRSVLLTPSVAGCFLDVVQNRGDEDVARILIRATEAGTGLERFKKLAAKSLGSGHPIVVKPKHSGFDFNRLLAPSQRSGRGLEDHRAIGDY